MKNVRSLFPLALMFGSASVLAQAPASFSYQAVMRDLVGHAMAGHTCSGRYLMRVGVPSGAVVYEELQTVSTNDQGLFTVQVGNGTPIGTASFSSINWRNGPFFLEVQLDVDNTGSFTSMGTQQLLSVPYALYAESSNIPDGTEVGQVAHWDGTTWVVDSGLYVYQKRFGIGVTQPEAPLGIKGEDGHDDQMLSLQSSDNQQKWNINLNPSDADVAGFSIDDASTGVGSSRLFIARSTGDIGINTLLPDAPLSIKSRDHLYQKFQNGDIPDQQDFVISSGGGTGLSFDQDTPDGTAGRLYLQGGTGHVGIGTQDPRAVLSIDSRETLKTYFETGDVPTQDQFGFRTDSTGFDIGQGAPDALQSRLFIQASSGSIGLGTTQPKEKLHVSGANDGGITGIRLLNTATANNQGWSMGHLQDASGERDGAFSILEDGVSTYSAQERMVIRSGGNVGINELIPDTKLHVSRDLADPQATTSLAAGSGIVTVGPSTKNIVFDYRGIQARQIVGGTTSIQGTSGLHLQPLGGDIHIHGDDAEASHHVTITTDGKIGVGKDPIESMDVNGAITLGSSSSPAPAAGTIRWTGTDFEGRTATEWVPLDPLWRTVSANEVHHNAVGAKVGIGTDAPTAALHAVENEDLPDGSTAAFVNNISSTLNLLDDRYLLGLRIATTGSGGGGGGAGGSSKNIGLYVSQVSGQSSANSNLAAVLNGNTVIGDLVPNSAVVGSGGTNVLAIQNGSAPSSVPGNTSSSGIQIYSEEMPGSGSAFHLMNGDGSVIKLYRAPAITTADGSPLGPGVDSSTAALIDNMRTRINQLENVLKNLGVLTP